MPSPRRTAAATWRPGHDRRAERHLAAPGALRAAGGREKPTALVLGGGIAGIAAAAGLAERGVRVTLLEQHPQLGGRVRAWPLDDGTTMSRGFHAFFRQYYNLRALLRRVDPTLAVPDGRAGLPAGRRQRTPGLLRPDPADPAAQHGRLRGPEPELPGRRPRRDRRRRRSGSCSTWTSPGRSPTTTGRAPRPSSTGCGSRTRPGTWPSRCSPAASSPDPRTSRRASWSACSTPTSWARRRACCSTSRSTTTTPCSGRRSATTWSGSASRCGPRSGSRRWLWTATAWRCRPRPRGSAPTRPCWPPTCGPRGSWSRDLPQLDPDWRARIAETVNAPRFAVWRLWLDRRVNADRPAFLGTSGYGPLDNITVLERFEAGARRWSQAHGGSVVEVHAYALPGDADEASVRATLRTELARVYPETAAAAVVAEEWLVEDDCPLVGTDALAPPARGRHARRAAGAGGRRDPLRLPGGPDGAGGHHRLPGRQPAAGPRGSGRARPVDRTDPDPAPAAGPGPATPRR